MASAKELVGNVLGRLFFHDATVTRVRELSPRFREIELEGAALRSLSWRAGDKVQVATPGMNMRTYTPLHWDTERGATAFLVYLHGSSPGAQWGREARAGASVQFFGPRRSLSLDDHPGATVFFGDETSFGVAHAFKKTRAAQSFTSVFEVSHPEESAAVLGELGLEGAVARTAGEAHLAEVHERLRAALQAHPEACLVMTGKAQSIQALRGQLKASGLKPSSRVKAYWSVGKTGLD
jgi:NADPH-dependent ferric siderophore reductase